MKGAAWSVPVIAVAASTPMAAASGPVVIEPNVPAFAVLCEELGSITFTLSDNGGGVVGATVVVSLTGGFTWSDGTTTPRPFVTGPGGVAVVDAVMAPPTGTGTSGAVTATVQPGGPTVTTPIGVVGARAMETTYEASSGSFIPTPYRVMGAIPADSEAIAWNVFLAPNGDLFTFHRNTGYTLLDTGVTSVDAQHYLNNSASETREVDLITYVKGGEMKQYVSDTNQGNTPAGAVSVPAGSTAVSWNTVLAPNGDLLRNGTTIASNVTSATAQHQTTGAGEVRDFVSWTTAAGAFTRTFGGTSAPTATTFASVPAGSTTVGFGTYLTPAGQLYNGNSQIATGVVSAYSQRTRDGAGASDMLTWATASGDGYVQRTGTPSQPQTQVVTGLGADAQSVGWATWLTADGRLYKNATLMATGVQSADSYHEYTSPGAPVKRDWIAWTEAASDCA